MGKSSQQRLDRGGEQTLSSQTEEHSESWSFVHWTPGPMKRNGLGETWKNWLLRLGEKLQFLTDELALF